MTSAVDIRALACCAHHGRRNHIAPAVDSHHHSDQYDQRNSDNHHYARERARPGWVGYVRFMSSGLPGGDHELTGSNVTSKARSKARSSVSETLPGDHMTDAESRGNKHQQGHRAVELHVAGAPGESGDAAHAGRCDRHLRGPGFRCRRGPAARGGRSVHPVDPLGHSRTQRSSWSSIPRDDVLVVEASAACDTHDVVAPGSFSWHVLTSLGRRRADLPRRARPR